jgi:cystathionine beta-lyase/cystathionine gamma-synthase
MATDPRRRHRFYTRYGNPTVSGFEEAIAELEGAEAARAFASGMGAISAVVLGLCSSGDHIVAQRQLYAGTSCCCRPSVPGSASTSPSWTPPSRARSPRRCGRARRCW